MHLLEDRYKVFVMKVVVKFLVLRRFLDELHVSTHPSLMIEWARNPKSAEIR